MKILGLLIIPLLLIACSATQKPTEAPVQDIPVLVIGEDPAEQPQAPKKDGDNYILDTEDNTFAALDEAAATLE